MVQVVYSKAIFPSIELNIAGLHPQILVILQGNLQRDSHKPYSPPALVA